MDNGQFCRNCGRYKPAQFCEHDNIERIMRQERSESCPFWVPVSSTIDILTEVTGKLKKYWKDNHENN
jgi:hypothetical protein